MGESQKWGFSRDDDDGILGSRLSFCVQGACCPVCGLLAAVGRAETDLPERCSLACALSAAAFVVAAVAACADASAAAALAGRMTRKRATNCACSSRFG